MKKISTAAAKAIKNFSQQKLTIGLDLGDRSSWYCLLDEVGEVMVEQKLGTTPKAMREVFGSLPRCRIALETGMHSPWVSRVLSELEHEVIVAHARSVRLIGESRKKDDRGACPQRALDRGKSKERRSDGCADPGAVGQD
jgi:transposase